MIKRVILKNFKMFKDELPFELEGNIVLAGPNNSGKSTLLQALSAWNLAKQKWLEERGPDSGSRAKMRTGVTITRKDFTAVPLREMNLLWYNRSTALTKDDLGINQKPGMPRTIEISVDIDDEIITFEFYFRHKEYISVKIKEVQSDVLIDKLKEINLVHVPTFSGIEADEPYKDRALQEMLVGQGKPGDILRNLIYEIYNQENDHKTWHKLHNDIELLFNFDLLPPIKSGPYYVCQYFQTDRAKRKGAELDINCAGSGFLQVLMLLSFFYARSASALLLDEPDAHLHIILQKQVYEKLREVAKEQDCQLIIATHSEVLIDNTPPEQILSFFGYPHSIEIDTERHQVREALKRISNMQLLMAEKSSGILYLEGVTDLDILREWAKVLEHPVYDYFNRKPFYYTLNGNYPPIAKNHFFALKAIKPEIRGVLLLDGDNRNRSEHEMTEKGLDILRWKRYEAENYLLHYQALKRYVEKYGNDLFVSDALKYLENTLPKTFLDDPFTKDETIMEFLSSTAAKKTLLPEFLKRAGINLPHCEYFQLASEMREEEIDPEVKEKLDKIYSVVKSI